MVETLSNPVSCECLETHGEWREGGREGGREERKDMYWSHSQTRD